MSGEGLVLERMRVVLGGVVVLEVPWLEIAAGTMCGIAGPSGSGKTTLLHVAAGLLAATEGSVRWGGMDLERMGGRDAWRRRMVGFVFQDFCLVPELTARENVLLPVWFAAWSAAAERAAADGLLARMGITATGQRAGLMSRGEQQRVAIARALLGGKRILLADEPTASLDAAAAEEVGALLVASARAEGAVLLVVSHDAALLGRMDRVVRLEQGRVQ